MNYIVIYYSYTNNTKELATTIAQKLGADIFELNSKEPYSRNYDEVVSLGQYEVDNNIRREIKEIPDISKYNKIIILTPTWWYKPTPIISTYLSDTDFSEKIVIPAMTNAGWPGTVIKEMTQLIEQNNGMVENPKEFKFNENKMITSEKELDKWINQIKEK